MNPTKTTRNYIFNRLSGEFSGSVAALSDIAANVMAGRRLFAYFGSILSFLSLSFSKKKKINRAVTSYIISSKVAHDLTLV